MSEEKDYSHLEEIRKKSQASFKERRAENLEQLVTIDMTPKELRRTRGLPMTDTAIAKVFDVTPATIANWRKLEDYQILRTKKEQKAQKQIDKRSEVVLQKTEKLDLANDDAATYQAVKAGIAADAEAGNLKAIEVYLRTWGRPFIDQEVTRVDALSDYSDEELVLDILEMVNPDLLAASIELLKGDA